MTSSVLLAMANEIRAVYEERDALRKSAKKMTAQRDAWLAIATTLAEQLHALQSAATPAPEPVDPKVAP